MGDRVADIGAGTGGAHQALDATRPPPRPRGNQRQAAEDRGGEHAAVPPMTFLNHKISVTGRTRTPGRKLRKRLSYSPAPAGHLHDVHFEPCLCQERKALCAWSGGRGHGSRAPSHRI
jgi:hypothetical protein